MGEGVGPCPARTRPPARSFMHPLPSSAFTPPPARVRDASMSARACPHSLVRAHPHSFAPPPAFRPPSSKFTPPVRAHSRQPPLLDHACLALVWPSFALICARLYPLVLLVPFVWPFLLVCACCCCHRGPCCYHPCCPRCRRPHGPSHGIYIKYIVSINTVVILPLKQRLFT
jgi:hypothetical protein